MSREAHPSIWHPGYSHDDNEEEPGPTLWEARETHRTYDTAAERLVTDLIVEGADPT